MFKSKWKRDIEKRLEEIDKRLEAVERAIGIGYVNYKDDGRIYHSISFRYGDDDLSINKVVEKLCEKVGVTVRSSRGPELK